MTVSLNNSTASTVPAGTRIRRFFGRLRRYGVLAGVLPFLQRLPNFGLALPIRVRCGKRVTWLRIRPGTTDPAVCYEMFLAKELEMELPRSPSVIVDAGAYTGISAAYFALRYPTAKIIAVEPNPVSFDLLQRNTNRFSNVIAIQAALWTNDTEVILSDRATGDWGFTIVGGIRGEASFRVPAISMKTLMQQYAIAHIDLLKLDIEGAERDVLEQSKYWIGKVGCIAVELHDRIQPGCAEAMRVATEDFDQTSIHGEKTVCTRRNVSSTVRANEAA